MQSRSKTKTQPPGEINESGDCANLKQLQKDIKTQLQFERLISELSTDFINLPFDQVDKKIKDGLKLMVEFLALIELASEPPEIRFNTISKEEGLETIESVRG
jgi:hypothetical protein